MRGVHYNFSLPTQHLSYLGTIQATKTNYRKMQLQNLIMRLEKEKEKCCSELLKEVDVLQAIHWMRNACEAVLPLTITECFVKCWFKTSLERIHYTWTYVFVYIRLIFFSDKDFELLMFPGNMNRNFFSHLSYKIILENFAIDNFISFAKINFHNFFFKYLGVETFVFTPTICVVMKLSPAYVSSFKVYIFFQ